MPIKLKGHMAPPTQILLAKAAADIEALLTFVYIPETDIYFTD